MADATAPAPVAVNPRDVFAAAQALAWRMAGDLVVMADDALSCDGSPNLDRIEQALRCALLARQIATGAI